MATYTTPTPVILSKNLYDPSEECWKQQQLRVQEVQKITKGKGALLCIIDDGVGKNTELGGVSIERFLYFANSKPVGQHSTFIASLIAGNSLGIFPELKIVSKQVLDPNTGQGGSRQIVSAIYKAKEYGYPTINLSLGSNRPDKEIEKALKHYCSNGINIATIASGNDGDEPNTSDWPANYAKNIQGVLSVGATQIDKEGNVTVALFSSRGIVTVAAPGHALKSMDEKNRIDFISGTSFAAPIVGSTIAAARTLINRPLYQKEVLDIISKTTNNTKPDANIGYGNISVLEFLKEVKKLPLTYSTKPAVISSFTNFLNCFKS